jgi:hypothetical protein
LKKPNLIIDSLVYSEQVGRNLQLFPKKGDMIYEYKLIKDRKKNVRALFIIICSNNVSFHFLGQQMKLVLNLFWQSKHSYW